MPLIPQYSILPPSFLFYGLIYLTPCIMYTICAFYFCMVKFLVRKMEINCQIQGSFSTLLAHTHFIYGNGYPCILEDSLGIACVE